LYVDPDYLREGIGSELMEFIHSRLENQTDVERLEANIFEGNRASIEMARDLGYRKLGEDDVLFEGLEDIPEVVMAYDLE